MRKLFISMAALLVTSTLASAQTDHPLNIVVSNDDGWRGDGGSTTPLIVALRDALVAHGHHVTVVAPATEQSTRGTAFGGLSDPITVENPEPGVYTVSGTPAMSVVLALNGLFAKNPPDLVVSGINPGGNHSRFIYSGTVGAMLTALDHGVPGIAVSIDANSKDSVPFKEEAAEYAANLVDRLAEEASKSHGPLLPRGIGLNVNFPAKETPVGTHLTTIDPTAYWDAAFANTTGTQGQPGVYQPSFNFLSDAKPSDSKSDWTAMREGYVSITPLKSDWTASTEIFDSLQFLTQAKP